MLLRNVCADNVVTKFVEYAKPGYCVILVIHVILITQLITNMSRNRQVIGDDY